MAYPPQLPPSTRTDSTVSAVNHAQDHNLIAGALADLLDELGANPSGGYADLTNRLLGVAAGQDQAALDEFRALYDAVVTLSGIDDTDSAVAALLTVLTNTETKAAVDARVRELGARTGFALEETTETITTGVVPVGSIDGVVYGRHLTTGGLYRSPDDGATFTLITNAVTPYGGIHKLGNGEVLVNAEGSLHRSTGWAANPATATWTMCLDSNGVSAFIASDVDTWGDYVIAAEYAVPRTPARYAYLSTDNGATFTIVRDLDAMHPGQSAETHWHAVALDPYAGLAHPRLWVSHGDGPRGVYYSDDLGASWTEYGPANTWQPMPMMATEAGIVTSTDQNNPDGVWLIPRNLSPRVHLARIPGGFWNGALLGFGTAATRDPDTGIVYILFRADQQTYFTDSRKAIIFATDGYRADIIYTTAQGGTVGATGSVAFSGLPAIAADGTLLATYAHSSGTRVVRGKARRGRAKGIADPGNLNTATFADRTSIGIGYGVSARNRSVILGTLATSRVPASDEYVIAIGEEVIGAGQAVAIGGLAKARVHGVTVGWTADGGGGESVAIGSAALIGNTNYQAVAIGRQAAVSGDGGIAVGKGANVSAGNGIAVGLNSSASNVNALAFGAGASASGDGAIALGGGASATGTNAVAFRGTTASTQGFAIGQRVLQINKLFADGSDAGPASADRVNVYLRLVGGKLQLAARFPTGAVQVITAEP